MRIKNTLSLIAFFATFVFSVMLIGLPKDNFYSKLAQISRRGQDRQNVRMLLWQDVSNGRFRDSLAYRRDGDSESYDLASFAESTEEYVNASQSIDDSNLPADFQAAWHDHMNAWRTHSEFLNNVKESADGSSLTETPFMLDDYDAQTYVNQVDEINRTWIKVLQVGRQYGVYVPVE